MSSEPAINPPQFGWPVDHVIPITKEFGAKGHLWLRGWHTGCDFACAEGTPVLSAWDGIVSKSHNVQDEFGLYIRLDHFWHGLHFRTYYAHLLESLVKVGQEISIHDLIGKSGASGNATGPHLHFGVKVFNEWVKPIFFDQGD